jgi:formylglycine-generating enzyme required for sulfatase activity
MNHRFLSLILTGICLHQAEGWSVAADIDFEAQVKPILQMYCLKCHGAERPKGGLSMDTREHALKGGEKGIDLVPGEPLKSKIYTSTILPATDDDVMPPKGEKLSKIQADILKDWIGQGAKWPEGLTLRGIKKVDFAKDIQPILEFNCVACHRDGHDKGGLRLDDKSSALKGGDSGSSIVPGKSEKSKVYTTTILPATHDDLMPPAKKGGPLPKEMTEQLRDWIDQGAPWPDGLTLVPKKAATPAEASAATVAEIYEKIAGSLTVTNASEMHAYSQIIPGSEVSFEMVPIPGGQFTMGSPDNEANRKPDEGPQHGVSVDPFWMGKCEITWNEYELFQFPEEEKKIRAFRNYAAALDKSADAVTRPTTPYVEMSFGMGKDNFPAISMTQHAANTYCKWLSAKTGQFYRLPTEAEWEYACRAGTSTAYSFGDDASSLKDYAWFGNNSQSKYQKVGKKKPNPWGLYDMHGNVAEWVLDQYDPDFYKKFAGQTAQNPWNKASKPYPHSVRGGSWDDDPPALRSSARRGSDKSWKQQDPQLPKSIWYLTDAQFIGFRIIRPLKVPPPEELNKYWSSGVERD